MRKEKTQNTAQEDPLEEFFTFLNQNNCYVDRK